MTYRRAILGPFVPASARPDGGDEAPSPATALVIAHPELWSARAAEALAGLGLHLIECRELQEALDVVYTGRVMLAVVAAPEPEFLIRGCRSLRGLQNVALVAIVAKEADLVPVIEAGADDCVPATAPPEILAARVKALLRRVVRQGEAGRLIFVRDLCLDLGKCEVTVQGRVVALTPAEFRLLACLAERAGRVVDSKILVRAMHGYNADERDAQNIVKVHIANLRRKLEAHRPQQPYIVCVRGFGYMLDRRSRPRQDDPMAFSIEGAKKGASAS